MKKTNKYLAGFIIAITLMASFNTLSAKSKTEVVTIKTSAVCESCKARIEKALKSSDGVISANLNLENKKIKVKFDPDKTSAEKIRTAIANTGYDADNVKKTPEAFTNLPHCCQKDGGSCDHKK